ncbi:DNA-binding response regulator [bacterium (Candidatus Blackallbacteria) CG17_big_fil_post_rev_8_21_14_2_50_48_46]|uniref:DNA-binding response regulator n=1 Tax=bacterium (Candidatus Blackallbacteria) CG17_big_fil_post_rev_8_21_14_2_50_48_46 TaxID=2014261 RepID=A0A2M7G719_9BACT|nr:MAG: DNA-binding response regulator [bacterium (Candidatus Blackallbacteria) CG18_big_fil_WC_8_21_14_2_50_49_26]PIW17852.1 MAG: DNA-binding response regulator [bacterium (Candidatus Blackallbacteria) CG17_big_fil_post_rev_8_21_14_2_50_48_46]PIW48528.1 MAG: DNA-binding response regulator [bacterium (Candidatus Blackallbacteria) CG13_big_fil_rev_8_21_14_2_50_49_14]
MADKILLVDDEESIVESIEYALKQEGFEVVCAHNGQDALQKVQLEKPNLIVLDLMLPELSGLEVCRMLRRERNETPIIMLTAKGEEIDRVIGLEVGADDYLVKPFSLRELIARIRALLRRSKSAEVDSAQPETHRYEDLEMNLTEHKVTVRAKPVELSPKEFKILAMLMSSPNKVFSREELLEQVWGLDFYGDTKTVDVHIRWLREKIEADPSNPRYVQTVRGFGYRLGG